MDTQTIRELSTKHKIFFKGTTPTALYLIASLARGDYQSKNSDIDLLAVFSNETPLSEQKYFEDSLTKFIEKEMKGKIHKPKRPHWIDVLFVTENDVPTSSETSASSPFAIFSLFGFDLKENNILLYGNDVLKRFKPADPEILIDSFIDRWVERSKHDNERIVLYAGQILRAFSMKQGATTLQKDITLETITRSDLPPFVKDYARKHYKVCYGDNNKQDVDIKQEAYSFIEQINTPTT